MAPKETTIQAAGGVIFAFTISTKSSPGPPGPRSSRSSFSVSSAAGTKLRVLKSKHLRQSLAPIGILTSGVRTIFNFFRCKRALLLAFCIHLRNSSTTGDMLLVAINYGCLGALAAARSQAYICIDQGNDRHRYAILSVKLCFKCAQLEKVLKDSEKFSTSANPYGTRLPHD